MATLQEDIATYLISKNLITGYGEDCFGDFVPEEPNDIVVLYEYPGDRVNPFTDVVHRSIQVIVRNTTADGARALALSIHKALVTSDLRVDFTPTRFAQVHLRDIPFKLKEDENNRVYYCFNMGLTTTID